MSQGDDCFEPDPGYLSVLLSMGIDENVAREGLFCTGNKSAHDAINYIFNNSVDGNQGSSGDNQCSENNRLEQDLIAQRGDPADKENPTAEDEEWEDEDVASYKMTFVVNCSLKMGIGKIATQVAHACLGIYREMLENSMEDDISHWEEIGEKKIVLKGNSTEHLIELYEKAKEAKIPAYLVRDAGHTQIPRGSVTVLSLFGLDEHVDKISGKLSLL